MEVHHHPDLHHRPKKWKEYLLEFLMIFLAVTLGFFAENIRESLVEQNKEKQFILSMIEDLKSDTIIFRQNIDNWYGNTIQIDTLVALLTNADIKNKSGRIYNLERVATRNITLPFYNSRTFEQMKNSGSLTLIRKAAIANAITNYYNSIRRLDEFRALFSGTHEQLIKDEYLIFDSYTLFQTKQKRPYKLLTITGNPSFTKFDTKDFNQYLARLNRYYTLNLVILDWVANYYLPATKKLLSLLQTNYGNE